MTRFRCSTLGFTLAALLTVGRTGAADPVRITSGYLTVGGAEFLSRGFLRSIYYDFSTESFRLTAFDSDGPTQRVFSPGLVTPSFWTPSGGSALTVAVSSTLVFTATPGSTPTPFQLSGTLSIVDHWSSGATLFNDFVSGSGTATWRFDLDPLGRPVVSGVTYRFDDVAPVPEPATFILLAAGLGAVAARRRRRQA